MDDQDLEALFEAAQAEASTAPSAAPAAAAAPAQAAAAAEPVVTSVARESAAASKKACPNADPDGVCRECTCGDAKELRTRIGKLTRDLHESLQELQLDETLAEMAVEIPDARNRLKYVTDMCERSAQKVLDALDVLGPLHEQIRTDANALHARWDHMMTHRERPEGGFMQLFEQTRDYLGSVGAKAQQASSLHTEIMMAQDFQDLTGQVCRKIEQITHRIETQLIHLLVDTAPEDMKPRNLEMLEGPQVTQGRADAVSTQSEVDSLLSSLGF